MKESLFNIIASYIQDADVLDLFAGTGNLGIESLSRGAKSAVFIDKSQECNQIIRENLEHTKLEQNAEVYTGDVFSTVDRLAAENRKFDVIFLDPPYNKNLIEVTLNSIVKNDIIKEESIIIAERDIADNIPENIGYLCLFRNQKYGDTILSFYKKCSVDSTGS